MTCEQSSALPVVPSAKTPSSRIHSHYQRTVRDVPTQRMTVVLRLWVRIFYCDHPTWRNGDTARSSSAFKARVKVKVEKTEKAMLTLPKVDLHIHQEVSPRLDRVLARAKDVVRMTGWPGSNNYSATRLRTSNGYVSFRTCFPSM